MNCLSIGHCPLDDSIAESPHARAAHVKQHTRACLWEWLALTGRLGRKHKRGPTVARVHELQGGTLSDRRTLACRRSATRNGSCAPNGSIIRRWRPNFRMADWRDPAGAAENAEGKVAGCGGGPVSDGQICPSSWGLAAGAEPDGGPGGDGLGALFGGMHHWRTPDVLLLWR